MSNTHKIINGIVLAMLFVVGLWTIDIGASAMLTNNYVQSLFFIRTGNQQYHMGLILSMVCFMLLIYLYVKEVLKNE